MSNTGPTYFTLFGWHFTMDTLIQTFGGLLGSLFGTCIAGLVTLYVMKHQLKYDSTKQEAEHIERFIKDFLETRDVIHVAYDYVVTIQRIRIDIDFDDKQKKIFEGLLKQLSSLNKRISQFDNDKIPYDIYKTFLHVKTTFADVEGWGGILLFGSQGVRREMYHKLQPDIKILAKEIDELDLYCDAQESQLRNLKEL